MTSTETGPAPVDLTVRPAAETDAAPLAELFGRAREAAHPAMPRPVHGPPEVRAWFEATLAPGSAREAWVAESDGRLVGYLVLEGAWIHSLYVDPHHSGRGVGSVLLDLAKSLRPDGFGLWVFTSNDAAQRFYRGHGLAPVRRTDGSDNEEGAPDVEMMWPGRDPLGTVRRRIDGVDDRLAELLNERALLTAMAQRLKPVAGHAGRDPQREAQIVARMAARAPDLGEAALARIMHAVISASLDAVPSPAGPDPEPDPATPGPDPEAGAARS